MKHKVDYLHQLILQDRLQFFGLSETWPTNIVANSFLTSRSHLIIRQDRAECRGGGVALYYNSAFHSNHLASHLDYCTGVEFILVESALSHLDTILHLIVYKPPHINKASLVNVFNYLRPLVSDAPRHIFCGDLNLDCQEPDKSAFIFLEVI